MTEIDEMTLRLATRGDQRASKRFYDFYAPFVWRVIYRTVNGDTEAAGEVLQQSFIRIFSSLKKFKKDSAISTWIYRIAYNVALTFAEKTRQASARMVEADDTLRSRDSLDLDTKREVEQILRALSEEERFLLTAREVEGVSFEDLATITGKNSGALRTSLHRLKERIRQEFGHE